MRKPLAVLAPIGNTSCAKFVVKVYQVTHGMGAEQPRKLASFACLVIRISRLTSGDDAQKMCFIIADINVFCKNKCDIFESKVCRLNMHCRCRQNIGAQG